jgi:hypothetical protein
MGIGCLIGITMMSISSLSKNYWTFFALYGTGFGICNGLAVNHIFLKLTHFSILFLFTIAGGISQIIRDLPGE